MKKAFLISLSLTSFLSPLVFMSTSCKDLETLSKEMQQDYSNHSLIDNDYFEAYLKEDYEKGKIKNLADIKANKISAYKKHAKDSLNFLGTYKYATGLITRGYFLNWLEPIAKLDIHERMLIEKELQSLNTPEIYDATFYKNFKPQFLNLTKAEIISKIEKINDKEFKLDPKFFNKNDDTKNRYYREITNLKNPQIYKSLESLKDDERFLVLLYPSLEREIKTYEKSLTMSQEKTKKTFTLYDFYYSAEDNNHIKTEGIFTNEYLKYKYWTDTNEIAPHPWYFDYINYNIAIWKVDGAINMENYVIDNTKYILNFNEQQKEYEQNKKSSFWKQYKEFLVLSKK